MVAHADNLAERTCEGVDRYLEFNTLNRKELYLLLEASQEGPTVSKAFSAKLRVSIVWYFARSGKTNLNADTRKHMLKQSCRVVNMITHISMNTS